MRLLMLLAIIIIITTITEEHYAGRRSTPLTCMNHGGEAIFALDPASS